MTYDGRTLFARFLHCRAGVCAYAEKMTGFVRALSFRRIRLLNVGKSQNIINRGVIKFCELD